MSAAKDEDVQVLLTEFTALRAEILQLLSMQWNILALQLTGTGVIFSLALARHNIALLLILPVVTYALSNQYLGNYYGMQKLGIYIMEELGPRVPGGLHWEEWQRERPHRPYVNLFQRIGVTGTFAPLPTVFPAVSVVALAWVGPYILLEHGISTLNRSFLAIIWTLCVFITVISLYSVKREQKSRQVPKNLAQGKAP